MTLLSEFEILLQQTMGLDAASVGATTVERAVRQRTEFFGLESTEEYWEKLQSSREELQELIETVVVSETWFFRDAEAFAAMVSLVTEERLSDRPSDVVRLLSVPCSTGEEPYSMVMALLDGGLLRHQIKVDAIDISARVLAYARRGVYGRNSFRGENTEFRERYFRSTPDGHALMERLSGSVNFQIGNLVSGALPRPTAPYDVIFCRNLLIYFDRPTQEAVMKTLGSLLSPEGFLFVGPAEAYLAASCGFTSVNRAMSFAFRKTKAGSRESATQRIAQQKTDSKSHLKHDVKHDIKVKPSAAILSSLKKEPAPVKAIEKPAASVDGLAEARRLADLGRLQEAVAYCESTLGRQGPSVETYYLLGVVHDAAGDRKRAAECYRRVTYLEPDHVEALTHLALLTHTEGDVQGAQRLRQRAQRASEKGGPKA